MKWMSRKPVNVTQADLVRAIRAAKAAGLLVLRIHARTDGYVIETATGLAPEREAVRIRPKSVL